MIRAAWVWVWLATCLVPLVGATRAEAQDERAPPFQPPESTAAREAERAQLFDRALEALADGDLGLAERTFTAAAALPGDPTERAVAASFADRVRRLRAERTARLPPPAHRSSARAEADRAPGRVPMLSLTTVLGLGLYGWTLPKALGVDPSSSPRGFVGVYMLTAAASFAIPYFLIGDAPVSAAQASLAYYGGTRGIWHGLLVGSLVAGDLTPDVRSRGWAVSMLAGSVAELVGGYHLAAFAPTAGQARLVEVLGDFGLLAGFGAGYVLRLDQATTSDAQARGMAAAGLAGSVLGLGAGLVLAHEHEDDTWGDGEALRACVSLGVLTAAAIGDLAHLDVDLDDRPFTAMLMIGGTLGLVGGGRLLRSDQISVGDATVIDLTTVAGGLLTAGILYLADHGGTPPYLLAADVGAVAGFAVGYWASAGRLGSRKGVSYRRGALPQVALAPLLGGAIVPGGARGLALAGRF